MSVPEVFKEVAITATAERLILDQGTQVQIIVEDRLRQEAYESNTTNAPRPNIVKNLKKTATKSETLPRPIYHKGVHTPKIEKIRTSFNSEMPAAGEASVFITQETTPDIPRSAIGIEPLASGAEALPELNTATVDQRFAEIVERLSAIESDGPVPEFAPDAEAILAQLDFELDEALVEFVTADADVELIDGEVLDSIAELASGEAELELSEADLQLLEEWAVLMVDAQPEDFAVSAEDEMSIHADYQEILEQIDGATDEAAAEMAADTVEAAGHTIETQAEMAAEATVESGNQEEQSVEIPAEVTPLLATAVEQISEHIALLDSEAVAETHALLADVSRQLQAVEKIVLDLEAAAESVANVEEAEAVLVQSIQKLCEHIGLDYSEEQITQLVQQLLEAQVGTINLHNQTMVGSAEINQIDLNTGTHEALSWFMSSIKQLKKQTSWLHLHVLLGKRIMALMPDVFAVSS